MTTTTARPRATARTVTAGIDVDRDTITYAVARGGVVTEVDQLEKTTLAAALPRLRGVDHVIVAWNTASGSISRDPDLFPAEESRLRCSRRRPGEVPTVGIADRADIVRLWPSGEDLRIVLAPMVISTAGTWLGIRRDCAELTVIGDKGLQRSRPLVSGGLSTLGRRLDWDGLTDLLTDPDPSTEGLTALDDYTCAVAREVMGTLSSWRKSAPIDHTTVRVYGPGSTLPTLEARLAEEGATALAPPLCPGAPGLDAGARAEAWLAIEAALADPTEFVGFPDVRGDARREAIRRAANQTRRFVALCTGIAAVSAGILVPVAHGTVARHIASDHLATAKRTIASLAAEEAAYRFVQAGGNTWAAHASAEPSWARLLDAVFKTAPPPVGVLSVDADSTSEPGVVVVLVRANGSAQTFADLETWSSALAANPAVGRVFAPSAASDAAPGHPAGKTTFELQFTVVDRALQSPRQFPGDQQ